MKDRTIVQTDRDAATMFIMRVFNADVSAVWEHFSRKELLDRWWAPTPWRCETGSLDFKEGGVWQYAMVGPAGERHYAGVRYNEIMFHRSIAWSDYFSDSAGNMDSNKPVVDWLIGFTGVQEGTKLTVNLHFRSAEDMEEIIQTGFEEGFKAGLDNLERSLQGGMQPSSV